jgi:hypothetical protein
MYYKWMIFLYIIYKRRRCRRRLALTKYEKTHITYYEKIFFGKKALFSKINYVTMKHTVYARVLYLFI